MTSRIIVLWLVFLGVVLSPYYAVGQSAAPFSGRIEVAGPFTQGALLRGSIDDPGATLLFENQKVPVSREGQFLLGLSRDMPGRVVLEARYSNGDFERHRLAIKQRDYPTQRINGLPSRMVTPSAEQLKRIRRDVRVVKAARARGLAHRFSLMERPIWPTKGRITGVYGSQRILNNQPRRPHYGIDIAAVQGTPVVTTLSGTVVLAESLYFTGYTVIIDHGFGLTSTYSHLSKLRIKEGQRINQGDVIGEVGSTGRSTGAHLDFRVNLGSVRLDPKLVLGE